MTLQPMLITPFVTGLDTDLQPELIPPDGFTDIDNMHVHHGYIEKREGYRTFGALQPSSATKVIVTISNANPAVVQVTAHGYSTGNLIYINGVTGLTNVNGKIFTIIVLTANTFSINFNTVGLPAYISGGTTSVVNPVTDRVMGITRYIKADGTKSTLAFNTVRAFLFNTGTQVFDRLDAANIMSGGVYDYINAVNWQSGGGLNRLYFTNGKAGSPLSSPTVDGIRYYDGSTTITNPFNPILRVGPPQVTLVGAKLIFSIGQRLVTLYTYEYNATTMTTYPQRARWCAKQDPSNWNDVIPGGGGSVDAATGDQIITAQALQNIIIVLFTNSVWALVPTSDPRQAFKWQRINNFRASDGKMASQAYDRFIKALGVRGITATDGVESQRVDERISTFVNDYINTKEFGKVFCQRSYVQKRWWTLYPDVETVSTENNSALIFDDESSAYTTYTIALNCLGYGNLSQDYAWEDFTESNNLDKSWDDFDDETWNSYFWQDTQEIFLGGDINGQIYVLESGSSDNGLPITSSFTTAAWNPYRDQGLEARMNYVDIQIETQENTLATIFFYKDSSEDPYMSQQMDFLPPIGFIATIAGAFAQNPVLVNVPQHGLITGDVVYIYNVQGMIEINSGESGINYTITVIDENNITLGVNGSAFNTYIGGGALYQRPFYRTMTWKRVYAGGIGFQHRMGFESTGINAPFRIYAFKPFFSAVGNRMIN